MLRWIVLGGPHLIWLGLFCYLYNSAGSHRLNYDTISVALTALEVVLVVFGLAGFGFLAILAEKRAEAVAKPVARKAAEEEVRKNLPSTVRRLIAESEQEQESLGVDSQGTADAMQKLMDALDGKEDNNGKK